MSTRERKGITVRFEDHEMEMLDELAQRYHVTSATIIRWALKALADYVEVNGGRIVLPLDFTTFYERAVQFPVESLKVAEDSTKSSLSTRAGNAPVVYPKGKRSQS
jgi:hypothetical protein